MIPIKLEFDCVQISTTEAGLPNLLQPLMFCQRQHWLRDNCRRPKDHFMCGLKSFVPKEASEAAFANICPDKREQTLACASCNLDCTALLVVSRHAIMTSENVWSTELD